MTAIGLRLRAELRARGRSWLALALAIGVAAGIVMALAASARRTDGAYGRYLRAITAADAYVATGLAFGDPTLGVARFARLPQVARSERTFLVAVISRSRGGRPIFPLGPDAIEYQVPSDDRPRNTIDAPLLLHGRLPDPARPDEVLADRRALHFLGIGLGDRFVVRVLSHRTLAGGANVDLSADPRSPRARRWGALETVRVVGVQAHAKLDVDGGYVNLTPAFRRAHEGAQIGAWGEEVAVRLRRGAADVPAFRDAAQGAAGSHPYGFFDPATTTPMVRRSIGLMVAALWLLTAAAGAAALLLLVQAILRQVAAEARSASTLRALGMTPGQLVALAVARGAVVAALAVVVAATVAVLLSPLAPVGWARELEPRRGIDFDLTVIALGSAITFIAVVAAATAAVWRGQRSAAPRGAHGRPRASLVASALARSGLPPAAATGIRMALLRRTPNAAVPVWATLASGVAAVAVAVVAMTFAQSVAHLLATPRLYGQTWDYETTPGGTPRADIRAAMRDPAVQDVARAEIGPVEIADRTVGVRAIRALKGAIRPTVLEGRAPRAPDEALLGTRTLRAAHLGLGDRVTIRSGHRGVRLRIVGRGVLPADKWNDLGQGVAMPLAALRRIEPGAQAATLLIRFRPGVNRAAAFDRMDALFNVSIAVRPQDVGDAGRVHAMPLLVSIAFCVAAAAALGHLLVTSVRRRRRDLAILKTLGFTRLQVMATIAWQATTIAAASVLVGLPLGVAVGRFGWNVFAEHLGIVPEAVIPVGPALLVIPAAVLLANLLAMIPARAAAVTRPAVVLRAE